jgi:lipoprotein-releasing system ATP-binding protein
LNSRSPVASHAAPPSGAYAAQTPQPLLRAEDLWKSYDDGSIQVLKGVDFEAFAGRTVALCGPSGCGKSTLLHLLGGLDEPDRGRVLVHGADLASRRRTHFLRHEVGFVFQLHNLIPDLTLEENCLIPTVAAGTPRRDALARLHDLAERTGLTHRLAQRIQKLSGGERQRTALCRALMNRPGILLADEPTGSLDERTSLQIFDLLLDLAHTDGITLVMATHDRALAGRCDRLVEMHDGKICE